MPIVNGHEAETGCYVDGHWGQYGIDRLADQAEAFGWKPEGLSGDPRIHRRLAERKDDRIWHAWHGWRKFWANIPGIRVSPYPEHSHWEIRRDLADEIEAWLNEHTPPLCNECGRPVEFKASGWYFHIGLQGDCPNRASDTAKVFTWHWHDGEFFLSPICDPDNREDCDDDTCAHWD